MEKPLVPLSLDYPKVALWDTDIGKKKLKIINKKDFPLGDVLKGIGVEHSNLINSFGITDKEEIKARLELAKFLEANHQFRSWINEIDLTALKLPTQEEYFLKYFDTEKLHNPFWEKINEFVSLLSSFQIIPSRLKIVHDFLTSSLAMEDLEKKMSHVMAKKIEGMAIIEGTISLLVRIYDGKCLLESSREHVHGYQAYSSSIVNIELESYPAFVNNNKWSPLNWIGCGKRARAKEKAKKAEKAVDERNKQRVEDAYKEKIILEIPDILREDIINGIKGKLEVSAESKKVDKVLDRMLIHVYFSYSKEGLELRIYGVEPHNAIEQFFTYEEFKGCTPEHALKIEEAKTKMVEAMRQNQNSLALSALRKALNKEYPFLFSLTDFKVECPRTDTEHKWFAVQNLYKSYFLEDSYEASCKIRSFFERHIVILKDVAKIVEILSEKAGELKTSLCYPDILEEGHHTVSFREIFPVHLISRIKAENIVPIKSLPVLNGQILGLTGYHGGGKTVTSLAVVTNIFLAQSGLPVFGQGFRLNVKDVLGMMFIERGGGSTCELLLDKIVIILKEIQNIHNSKVVLVLDEVGTGTQEMDGHKLGKDVLSKLSDMGVSVLFSTQIQSLAEFARDELGAQCLKVDEKHGLSVGIGTGGMDSLRKRKGLDKLLK